MDKMRKIRISLISIILILIISFGYISLVISQGAMDFKNWAYDIVDHKMLIMDKPSGSDVLYSLIPAAILSIFCIFSLVYVCSKKTRTLRRKWPYITLLVLLSVTFLLTIFGNMTNFPIEVKDSNSSNGASFKNTSMWVKITDHWDDVKDYLNILDISKIVIVVVLVLVTIAGLILTIKHKPDDLNNEEMPYANNYFNGFAAM